MYSLPAEDLENIFLRLESIWPRNTKVLITGGTGFFGRWLVESIAFLEERLRSQNHFIVVSRQQPEELIKKIAVLRSSIFTCLQQNIEQPFLMSEKIDYVIHAASDVAFVKNFQKSEYTANVVATENVIAAVQSYSPRFLYVSSGGVYKSANAAFDESDECVEVSTLINTYSKAKRCSELLVTQMKNYAIARCFSFVGPFADHNMVAMNMLAKKAENSPIVVNSPEVVRSFMYPTDLVVALFKILFLPARSSLYNVGSDAPITLAKLAALISQIEMPSEVVVSSESSAVSLAGQFYYPSTERFDTEFGSSVTVNLETALKKTLYFLSQRKSA